MGKYGVNLHYDVVLHVEVDANDEYEALSKAETRGYDLDLRDGDVFSGQHCITYVKEYH